MFRWRRCATIWRRVMTRMPSAQAAPLVAAADAILFDTTAMDADAAFARALALIKAKLG